MFALNLPSQNLVLNPDFSEVVEHKGDLHIFLDTFYAKHWFPPTGGSVDIYRNRKLPRIANFNLDVHKPFETEVVYGDFCLGLLLLTFRGDLEHITGTLKQPLDSGKSYAVSFYIRLHPTTTPFISKGMGYKFSTDSIVFEGAKKGERGRASPFYDHLFENH